MSRIRLPMEFVSGFSPDECASRLEMKRGNYLGIRVKVNIEPQPHKGYGFMMHVTGTKNRNYIDLVIDGRLEDIKYDGTRVVVERSRPGLWAYIRLILTFVVIIGIVLGVAQNHGSILGSNSFLLFMAIVLATLLSVMASFSSQSALAQIVQLIEDAVNSEEEPVSKPAQVLNDFIGHLSAAKHKRHS